MYLSLLFPGSTQKKAMETPTDERTKFQIGVP